MHPKPGALTLQTHVLDMEVSVARICRYPVKGLSAEEMTRVELTAGRALPQDRRFALARAGTRFNPARPEWLPKTRFLMLMRDEELAQLRSHFDERSGYLTLDRGGRTFLRAKITESLGKDEAADFFADFLNDSIEEKPTIVEAPGHTFADAQRKPDSTTNQYVSIVNLASVRALEEFVSAAVDPIRFRANLYVDGLPAWEELDLVGSEITIGEARLKVVSPIIRCAATEVNPTTAERDLNIPKRLQQGFGQAVMGIYAEVTGSGEVAVGDFLRMKTPLHDE